MDLPEETGAGGKNYWLRKYYCKKDRWFTMMPASRSPSRLGSVKVQINIYCVCMLEEKWDSEKWDSEKWKVKHKKSE